MQRYRITEYRGVNFVGYSASSTSVICADSLKDAKLKATCINMPKGEWRKTSHGTHEIGSIAEGNMSIVKLIPERPECKDIKDKFTRHFCQTHIFTNKTFQYLLKMFQREYVLRISPFYDKGMALYHPETGHYKPSTQKGEPRLFYGKDQK